MGFRFRKSVNLGGGFRINFSKSGIGYSHGFKGARITKKANGGVRTTLSIPRTGISYVEESDGYRRTSKKTNRLVSSNRTESNNYYTASKTTPVRDLDCPFCGNAVARGQNFCTKCGRSLPSNVFFCNQCGEEVWSNQEFCPNCDALLIFDDQTCADGSANCIGHHFVMGCGILFLIVGIVVALSLVYIVLMIIVAFINAVLGVLLGC